MEQGTPIFESFTESVGDGPSQPLIRKLMSLMLQPDTPRGEPGISGFFLVEAPQPLCMAGTSRDGHSEVAEDIGQVIDSPVEEVENIVQSGFRFGGTEGCCDTPGVENYLSESRIPIDLVDKVPIDLLHAMNDAMDTKSFSRTRGLSAPHITGVERVRGAAPQVRNMGEELFSLAGLSPLMGGGTPKRQSTHGEGNITRRLDRLENICLRTESYVHEAFGTLDKRLQLLEAEAVRPGTSTRDSSCMTSPRSTPARIPCEVGTFVTPEMFVMPSSAIGVSCPILEDAPASSSEDAFICLSPVDTIPSPSLITSSLLCTPIPLSSDLRRSGFSFSTATPESAESFHAGISVPESQFRRGATAEAMAPATPATRDTIPQSSPSSSSEAGPSSSLPSEEPEDVVEKTRVSGVAIFSLAGDATTTRETTIDALLSEPVVAWENEGFPFLRPTFQIAMEPPLKETTVLTWDAVGYLSAESTSDEADDGATSVSGDEAVSFYNFEDEPPVLGMEECSSRQAVAREYGEILSNEDSILNEISSVLQNICTNLEALKEPQQNIIYIDAPSTSGSCPHCHADVSQQESLAWQDQDEVISVLAGVFSRLESSSHPENMLVSISPMGEPGSTSSASVAPVNQEATHAEEAKAVAAGGIKEAPKTLVAEHVSYAELPQQENFEEEEKVSSFEVVPLDSHSGIIPKVALSFNEESAHSANEEVKVSSSVQDLCVKIDLPPVQDATSASKVPASPVTVHVAVVPKELQHHQEQDQEQGDVSSIVQDICVTVEGPYQEPIICDKDIIPEPAPENRESVTISKDKLQLTDELSADYILKVVPRSSQQQEQSAFAAAASSESSGQPSALKQDLMNQEEVSSVIHELCFEVEVPTSSSAKSPRTSEEPQSTKSVSTSSPELPLQIAIALTRNSDGNQMSKQENAPCNLWVEASSLQEQQQQQQATVIFSLEALQKASVSSIDQQYPLSSAAKAESSTSIQRSSSRCSLEDYMAAEERPFPDDNHPLAFNWEGRADGTECEDIPCLLKIENRRTVAQDEVTSVHQEVCISVEVPTAPPTEPGCKSPTATASGVQIGIAVKTVPTRASDEVGEQSISRVEIPEEKKFEKAALEEMAVVAQRDVAPAKEELLPLMNEAESLYQEGLLGEEGRSIENVVEPIVAPPPSPVDSDAPGPAENPFKEEDKKPGFEDDEWIIETIFLARENIRPIEAKVPRPVVKGITPMDLIKGSLHYDGKACLLSVSMDDFWTAEDMSQAPNSAAAAFAKPKSTFEPFCLRGSVQDLKHAAADAAPQPGSEKNRVQTLGFQGGIKQVESNKVQSAFGFCHSLNAPEQPPQPQFTELVFGFRSSLQQSKPMQVQQQPPQPQSPELVFGFQKSQQSKPETQPPLVSILQQSLSISLPTDDVFADWDSSLSVVSRSPPRRGLKQTMSSSSKPSEDQEQLKPRVPESPGARSCILASAKGESPKGMAASTRVAESKLEQEKQKQVTRPSAAAAATPAATGTSAPREPLDLLDAPMSEEEQVEWAIGLHVLPLEAPGVLQEDTFFDALQCSGLDSKLENACAACLEALVFGYQRQRAISRMHTRHKLFLQPVASSS